MFFVLEIKERENTYKAKLHDLFYGAEVTQQKITPEKALPFYIVSTYKYKGKLPWKEIEKICGKLFSKAVLPSGITPDENTKIKSYRPSVLPLRALFFGAVRFLKSTKQKHSITVFDENGILCSFLEMLAFASEITVVTNEKELYEEVSSKILYDYGISVAVFEPSQKKTPLGSAVISCQSSNIPLTYPGLLFTLEKRKTLCTNVFCSRKIILPEKYDRLVPENTDRLLFASALYELCGAKELQNTEIIFE